MKKQKLFLFACLLLTGRTAFSQPAPEVDSKKIIDKGITFHDEKKYEEAAAEYKKIGRNDTNYVLAMTELIITYIANGKDTQALELCDKIIDIPSSYIPSIMTYKADALDNLKRSDEAIKIYEEGMKKYPLNYSFTYELGVLKLRQEKYKEAHDLFVKTVKVNPYHANTHFQLGFIAMKQGKLIPTMLAWQFYLTIDNSSQRAQTLVNALENLAKNEFDFEKIVKVDALDDQDDFSEIDALVKSKVALGKKYKSETKLNFNITKQIQLIMEKMVVAKDDKGFFMQFYAPFYADIYKNKFLETYSYVILAGMENKEVDAWVKKNTPKIDLFVKWLTNYIGKNVSTYEENLNGKMVKAEHFYSNGRKIVAVGNEDSKGENIGYWNFYYPNGILKSEGAFNDDNKRTGLWKFYEANGLPSSTENYVNGQIQGKIESFFSNGSIRSGRSFSNSLLDGESIYYYPTGVKKISAKYKDDIENGKQIKYHENGTLEYEATVEAGKFQGTLALYYMDGHLKEKATFKDDNRNGKFTEYYEIPENALRIEGNYDKGVLTGAYKTYHQNGTLSASGEFNKDGKKIGIWKSFNEDNILIEEETYNNGKNSGTTKTYTDKGKLAEEYIYKNDMLQEYKAYDAAGKVIYQNKKDGKSSYDVLLYHPNGNKKREGRIKDGIPDGKWKSYNRNGFVTSEENYTEGKKNGKTFTYFENGKIKTEVEYKDGVANGNFKKYHKNGKIRNEGVYVNDELLGVWNTYYANGNLQSTNYYKDDLAENWQQAYCANGKLESEDFFELGYVKKRLDYDSLGKVIQQSVLDKGTGLLDIKYPNGKNYWLNTYKYGLKQGLASSFYINGKPRTVKNYKDDKLDGEAKYYYPTGSIKSQETYINGDLNGKSINYYENGNVKSAYEYIYGIESGKSYYYHPNKQLQVEYTYKNNLLEGKTTNYDESGELMIIKNFEEGFLISYQYNDKTGNLVPPIELKNGSGVIKAYYKSGSPSIEYTLKNDAIEGKKVSYFPNGKISEECTFICDDREGIRKTYYSSGKIKSSENWKSDDLNGISLTYFENGKIKTEAYYLNDLKYGPYKEFDETGKLVKSYFYYDDEFLNEN
jgi:antitoxin component YwqK of YwqJK toxin-antitoxin module/Tfp pilus assembly protein PilF